MVVFSLSAFSRVLFPLFFQMVLVTFVDVLTMKEICKEASLLSFKSLDQVNTKYIHMTFLSIFELYQFLYF